MKIYIFICGRNINVYGSGNMCAHEKWLNIVAKKSLLERMKAFFGLEGFFSPNHRLSVSIGGHRVFRKAVIERDAFDTIVEYNIVVTQKPLKTLSYVHIHSFRRIERNFFLREQMCMLMMILSFNLPLSLTCYGRLTLKKMERETFEKRRKTTHNSFSLRERNFKELCTTFS